MAIKHRLFAGLGAALFLVTSSALTIAVILTTSSNNSNSTSTSLNTSAAKNSSCPSGYSASVGSKLSGFTPLKTPLQHLEDADLSKGKGATVKSGATITACYIGALADSGVIFDTSDAHGGPQTFSLSGVIPGWQLGIPGMKVGGTRELLIPSSLAYGSKANGSIPANSDLVFLVDVISSN